MANEKDIQDLTKMLTPLFREIQQVTKHFAEASESLSNAGIKKFTDEVKDAIKQTGLYSDAHMAGIKTAKEMQDTLEHLEDQYNKIQKLEAKARVLAEEDLKDMAEVLKNNGTYNARLEEQIDLQKKLLSEDYKKLDLTAAQVTQIRESYPAIKAEIEARYKNIKSTDGIRRVHEDLTGSLKKQIKAFGEFGFGLEMLKKAFTATYEQMNRLSGKGMLGAFTTLQMLSPKLLVSAQDLEEILNKNRDIINTMGGGIKGIEAFADEVSNVRGDLKFLGKDATKAAARFIEMSKKSGLTPKDGQAYRKNLNQSIEQFKEFSGLFGDSYEDYAALTEQLQEEENVRKRLNNLNKTQLAQELEAMRQRTENLKLMGLSNQQIVEFNKELQNIVNPRKNDFSERATQSIALTQSVNEMAKLLQTGNPEDQAILQDLQQNQGAIQKIADLNQAGRQKELADFMETPEGAKAARAYSKAASKTDMSDQFQRATRNVFMDKAGGLNAIMDKYGGALATSQAQEKDINGMPNKEDVLKNAADLQGANSKTADALNLMTTAVEGAKAIFENPLIDALTGAISMLWAFTTAGGISGALGALKSLGSVISGGGGLLSILGRGGAVAGAGAVGYELGKHVVAPLIDKGIGAISGAMGGPKDQTLGTAMYSGVNKLQSSGFLPGQSDEQKQRAADQASWQQQYKKRLSSQGYITKKQADLYTQNGVTVDQTKVEGAVTAPGVTQGGNTMPYDFTSFANQVANSESGGKGGGYGAINTLGYVGKYQFGAPALQDLGFVKKGTTNRGLNDPSNWLTPGGLQGFLQNTDTQEDAFKRYTQMHYQQLVKAGVITSSSTPAEIAGYLAAAHLEGVGGAIDLKNGKVKSDAYGTSTGKYFAMGAASQGGGAMTAGGTGVMTGAVGAMGSQYARAAGNTMAAAGSASTSPPGAAASPMGAITASMGPITSSPTATPVATTPPSVVADSTTTELKKQTSLLAEIVRNTSGSSRFSARPESYLQSPATVMGGVAG